MNDEERFLREHPAAKRLPNFDSATTRAYMTNLYLWLFDNSDGHLALKYDRKTEQTLYECEHIKQGRRLSPTIPCPKVYCPKEGKDVEVWHCLGSYIQRREPCSNLIEITVSENHAEVKCKLQKEGRV